MKHTALILAHRYPRQLNRLVQRLQQLHITPLVHVDAKQREMTAALEHPFISCYKVNWGGYSTVAAFELLLKNAVAQRADYYSVISGQCYPLMSRHSMEATLSSGLNYLEYYALPFANWSGHGGLDRYAYLHFPDLPYPRLRDYLRQAQIRLGYRQQWPAGIQPYGGSDWFTITHKAAEYLLLQMPKWKRFFRYTLLPSEAMVHTILLNSPLAHTVANNNLRMIEWHRGPEHPRTWRHEDLPLLLQSGKCFGRKFEAAQDMSLLDAIDKAV